MRMEEIKGHHKKYKFNKIEADKHLGHVKLGKHIHMSEDELETKHIL